MNKVLDFLLGFIACLALLAIVVFVNFSNNKIKVGDCVVSGDYEIHKVLKVGDLGGYMLQRDNKFADPENWHNLHGGLTKTDCFDSFDFMKDKK